MDLISRQEAINVLEERIRANGYSNVALVSELHRSIEYLMRLPSVQTEKMQLSKEDATKDTTFDCISRQAAIESADKIISRDDSGNNDVVKAMTAWKEFIKALPSVQPERLTDDDFETIRIHLNAYKESLGNQHRWEEAEEYQRIIDRFMAFASVQPEQIARDIATIIENEKDMRVVLKNAEHTETNSCDCEHTETHEWIPLTERSPENGHYYLWCSDMGSVQSDYYWNGFENGQKYGYTIVAWMPLPEAYKEGAE